MSENLIGVLISNIVTIIVVLLNGASTRNKLTAEISTNQIVMNTEMNSLKEDFKEMKEEVKKHNNFGLQIQEIKTRLEGLEKRINRGE